MRVVGFGLILLALVSYVSTVRAIWTLVRESRRVEPAARLGLFWWLPAWRVHRQAYPASRLRKQIVTRFGLTFGLMLAGMGFVAVYTVRHLPSR